MDRLFSLSPKELYEFTLNADSEVINKVAENQELMNTWWKGRFEYNLENSSNKNSQKDVQFDVYDLFPQQIIRKRNNFPDSVR